MFREAQSIGVVGTGYIKSGRKLFFNLSAGKMVVFFSKFLSIIKSHTQYPNLYVSTILAN